SDAPGPLGVSHTSPPASTNTSAHPAIRAPRQRMTRGVTGLSGRKLMRAHKLTSAIKANISAIASLQRCCPRVTRAYPSPRRRGTRPHRLVLDVQFFNVEVAEFGRGL